MADSITLIIDDRELTVPPGTVIADAAKQIGIDIPVFCHHPKLKPVGMCRMCLVQVGTPATDRDTGELQKEPDGNTIIRWLPNLQTACTTPVSEGMVVRTRTEAVVRARQDIIEFLLTSHPLDCPVCDKGGECPLQNQTMAYGRSTSRFHFDDKQRLDKCVPLGDLIVLDRERCIQCGRCARFQEEIADDPVLKLASRGRKLHIITFSDPPFDSFFSGNTTDICPVGALTTTDFRFQARPWELKGHPSLCVHCPVGCNITLDTRRETNSGGLEIKRVMPRQNEKVNEIWICDKGRFGHHHSRAADRLTIPLIRKNGDLVEATWEDALGLLARRIKVTPPAQIAGIAGDHLSNEDLFAFQALMRNVITSPHIDTYPHTPGIGLVARYGIGADSDWSRLDRDSVILVIAGDVEEQAPIWFLRLKSAVQRGAQLIVINGRETKLDRYADHRLRIRYGSAPHLLLGLAKLAHRDTDAIEGLKEFKNDLSGLSSAATKRLTGVTIKDQKAAVKTLAQAKDVIVIFGHEGLNKNGALALTQAAANLVLATGHVGRPNNGLLPLWPHNNTQGAADMGVRPNMGPGYREIIEHGWDFSSMLSTAKHGSIKLMWIAGADPVGDNPATAEALDLLNLLIVQDLVLTDTALRADIVLPALSFAERDGTFTSGDRRVQRFTRALPPLGHGWADWAIFADVARRLGTDWDFSSADAVLSTINKEVDLYAGITPEALETPQTQWPPVDRDSIYFSGTACQNNSGLGIRWRTKAEEQNAKLAFAGVELPSLPDAELIAAPIHRLYRHGTLISRSRTLEQHLRGVVAEFNPRDARRLGLSDGLPATISLGERTIQITIQFNRHVPKGIVFVPSHLPAGPLSVQTVAQEDK